MHAVANLSPATLCHPRGHPPVLAAPSAMIILMIPI